MYCPFYFFKEKRRLPPPYQKIGEKISPIYFYSLSSNAPIPKGTGLFGREHNSAPKPPCGGLDRQNVIK